jgi:hypothetical protein
MATKRVTRPSKATNESKAATEENGTIEVSVVNDTLSLILLHDLIVKHLPYMPPQCNNMACTLLINMKDDINELCTNNN